MPKNIKDKIQELTIYANKTKIKLHLHLLAYGTITNMPIVTWILVLLAFDDLTLFPSSYLIKTGGLGCPLKVENYRNLYQVTSVRFKFTKTSHHIHLRLFRKILTIINFGAYHKFPSQFSILLSLTSSHLLSSS